MTKTTTTRKRRYADIPPVSSIEDMVISPFDLERIYDQQGNPSWKPIERVTEPTSIPILDAYLRWLSDGSGNASKFCRRHHIDPEHLSGLCALLTGYDSIELQQQIHLRVGRMLLRYTRLRIVDVAHRCGLHSRNTFAMQYRLVFGISPTADRHQHHEPGRYHVADPLVPLGKVNHRPDLVSPEWM